MKKIAVFAIVTLTSMAAFAGDHALNLVSRAQWKYADNEFKKSGVRNFSQFEANYLRLKGAGRVNDVTTYTFSLDALNANAATEATNKTSNYIDTAFASRTIVPGTVVSFGKQSVLIGGREYDYSAADLYSFSTFLGNTPSNEIGLTVSQDFWGQNLQVQVINGNKSRGLTYTTDGVTTDAPSQTKMGYAVAYYGDFNSGMIKPILGYTVLPSSTNDKTFMSGGLQFNLPGLIQVEADYSEYKLDNGLAANKDKKTTSIVGLVRYNGENYKPFAKFISDKTDAATGDDKITAYDVGLEYLAAKDDNIRYHGVFSGSSVKPAVGTKYSPLSVAVGLKFNASILN